MLYDMGFCFYIEFFYFSLTALRLVENRAIDVIMPHHANHCV